MCESLDGGSGCKGAIVGAVKAVNSVKTLKPNSLGFSSEVNILIYSLSRNHCDTKVSGKRRQVRVITSAVPVHSLRCTYPVFKSCVP